MELIAAFESRLKYATSVADFFAEIQDVLEKRISKLSITTTTALQGGVVVAGGSGQRKVIDADVLASLLTRIERELGWDNIEKVDDRLGYIHISVEDAKRRRHLLEIHFIFDDSATMTGSSTDISGVFVICQALLPIEFKPKPKSSLSSIRQQFIHLLHIFQPLFDIFDDLDAHTCVLEPEHPTRSSLMRRIHVCRNASLHIDFQLPTSLLLVSTTASSHTSQQPINFLSTPPNLRFIGPEKVISPFHKLLSSRLSQWDELLIQSGNNLRLCLLSLLNLPSFPTAANLAGGNNQPGEENDSFECGICFCFRFEHLPPDITCDVCHRIFHGYCLFHYLRSLAKKSIAFNRISGSCPYCQQLISCKVLL